MKILLFFVVMIFSLSANAQQPDKMTIKELEKMQSQLEEEGRYEEALTYAKALCDKTKQQGIDSVYASSLDKMGLLYYYMGKYEQAEPLWLETKNIFKKVFGEKNANYASAINNLSVIYYNTGNYEQAEIYYLQAKEIYEAVNGKNSDEYASAINNLAMLYKELGKYEQAELLLLEAKDIRAKVLGKYHYDYALNLHNLGFLYADMKRYEDALKLYKEAQTIKAKTLGKMHPDYALGLNNMAAIYKGIEDFNQAEQLYLEATQIQEKTLGKMHPSYARSIGNLATLYTSKGEFSKAEKLLLEAKNIRLQTFGKEHPLYARSLNSLANVYISTSKLDTAFAYIVAAFDALSPQIDSSFNNFSTIDQYEYYNEELAYSIAWDAAALLKAQYEKTGSKETLAQYNDLIKASLRLIERIKTSFTSEEDKIRVLDRNGGFCALGVEAALKMKTDASVYEAFSFSERNKSMLISDALRGNRARTFGDLPDSLSRQESNLQQEWDSMKKQQAEARDSLSRAQVNAKMNELKLKIENFKKSLAGKYPKYHQQKYANITSNGKDIQALLSDKMAFLEYFVSDTIIYLFSLTQQDIQVVSIPISIDTFKKEVAQLRRCLTDYDYINNQADKAYSDYTQIAHVFYKKYLQTALQQLQGIEHLIIVCDNLLGHIPFEALLVEPAPAGSNYNNLPYLIRDFKISYNYSATLWKENKQTKKPASNAEILAFAADYNKLSEDILKKKDLRSQKMRLLLDPLPATENEILALSNSFNGQFLTKAQASERQFKQLAPQYGVIHLAMHGLLDTKFPVLSSLAFSEDGDSIEDNFLQVHEIAHLKLNADLVVLSACETGFGKFQKGEGVISLARSFMYAGAPALVVSLWQVNDASTSNIMQHFYENISQGQDKAAALQKAKIDYLSNAKGISAHPAFWAAFVQIGDESAISLNQKGGGWSRYIWGGATMLLGLGLIWFSRKIKK